MDKTVYILEDRKIRVEWTILKGTSPVREDFSRALVKVFLIGNCEKYLLEATADRGTLMIDIPEGLEPGLYSLEAIWVKNAGHPGRHDRDLCRSMKQDLFAITEFEEEATNLPEGTVVLKAKSSTATYGYDGLSSYELAVLRGEWNGTEGEWLKHQRYVSVLDGRGDSEVDTMSQKSITEELVKHDTAIEDTNKEIDTAQTDIKNLNDEMDKVQDRLAYIPKESFLSSEPACDYHTEDNQDELTVSRAIKDRFGRIIDEHYVTRETVKDYTQEVVDGSKLEIQPGSVQPEDLSPAVQQMIESAAAQPGHISNLPDEEDLTVTEHNTLQFKDREYNPYNYSGMGKVYLRKHIVNGTNMLTQHMMNKPNTIYVIRYDYCLGGETIEVPEGCVLEFDGGSLRNGTIVGNGTKLKGKLTYIFCNIQVSGNWNIRYITSKFFTDASKINLLFELINFQNSNIENIITIEYGDFYLQHDGEHSLQKMLEIKSNTKIILKGNIYLHGTDKIAYQILYINGNNVEVCGGGSIVGDKDSHLGTEGEWGHGIAIYNSSDVYIHDLTIKDCWGDSIYVGAGSGTIEIKNCLLEGSRRQGISVIEGTNVRIKDCYIKDISGTAPKYGIDIEPNENNVVENVLIENTKIENCGGGICLLVRPDLTDISSIGKVSINNCNIITGKLSTEATIAATEANELNITNSTIITDQAINYGIAISTCKKVSIDHNVISHSHKDGKCTIFTVGSNNITISHNEITSVQNFIRPSSNLFIFNNKIICDNFNYTNQGLENFQFINNIYTGKIDFININLSYFCNNVLHLTGTFKFLGAWQTGYNKISNNYFIYGGEEQLDTILDISTSRNIISNNIFYIANDNVSYCIDAANNYNCLLGNRIANSVSFTQLYNYDILKNSIVDGNSRFDYKTKTVRYSYEGREYYADGEYAGDLHVLTTENVISTVANAPSEVFILNRSVDLKGQTINFEEGSVLIHKPRGYFVNGRVNFTGLTLIGATNVKYICRSSDTAVEGAYANGQLVYTVGKGYRLWEYGVELDLNCNNIVKSGTSTDRPTSYLSIGFQYFDTTLNKPIWWTGSHWVDATGTQV